MNNKLFLCNLLKLIPLNYSLNINIIKKYQSASVACIFKIKNKQIETKNENGNGNKEIKEDNNNKDIYLSFEDICNKYDNNNNEIEILFIKRTKRGNDRWSGDVAFPGGFIDINENDKQGVIREVYEELGLNLSNPKEYYWLGRLKNIQLGHERTITPHVFCYLGKNEPILKIAENEVADAKWININVFLNKSDNSLDKTSFSIQDFISRSQSKNVLVNLFITSITKILNCSTIYFPAILLPTNSNEPPWVLWGMTLGIVTNLFHIVNNNQPFFQMTLPFWFDNRLVNLIVKFWKKILGGRMISRTSLIAISISSLFGLTGFSFYGLWNYSSIVF